jgi:hypothetical protein
MPVLRNFFRKRRQELKRVDPWEALIAASLPAVDEADRVIARAVRKVAPELGRSVEKVVLDVPRAERAFETVLSGIEGVLEEVCGRYDYRQLLFVSRLCAGLPWFRSAEDRAYARMRTRSADRWVLRCANRDLEDDFMRIDKGGYSIGHPPDSLFFDAVMLHVLAKFHARMVKEFMVFNFMRLVSSKNRLPGPRLRLGAEGRVGWVFGSAELQAAANMFVYRHDNHGTALTRWGMTEVPAQGDPFALAYDLFEDVTDAPYGGGTLFVPRPLRLDVLLEQGDVFRALFERDVGMPVEHLWAVSRGLSRLGTEAAEADGGHLADWAGLTGTLPISRDDLLGGPLEEAAREELARAFREVPTERSLGESVARFVDLASSSGSRAQEDRESVRERTEAARTPAYPFMIHGEHGHELWVVDYFSALHFFQGLVDRLEFSPNKGSTGLRGSDAFTRTSIFDSHLAGMLGAVPGVEEALVEHRDPGAPWLPNVHFAFGGENREIDVPMRFGEVLLAVQTWTPDADPRVDAGNPKAMRRRWDKVKDKLDRTDERYTDYLLEHPEGKRFMREAGLRHVLPIVCGPHPEPAVSYEPGFWLRQPSYDASGQLQAPPLVPRVATPPELVYFLYTATEEELVGICEANDWSLGDERQRNPTNRENEPI